MVRIPQAKIDEIINAADISNFISRYVALKKSGKNLKGLCPFHTEKTPSFMVSPEKQIYHCFGCGKGGNVVSFLMEFEKLSFIDAIRKIAFELGIRLPEPSVETGSDTKSKYDLLYDANRSAREFFKAQLDEPAGTGAKKYLRERKLKKSTLAKFDVGYAPKKWDAFLNSSKFSDEMLTILSDLGLIQKKEKGTGYFDKFRNRLMFPFHNASGRIVGFGGRRLDENDQPKYLNSPESIIYKKGEILYGLFQAIQKIREKNSVIIVEGYFDLLRLVDNGIENVVASSGTAVSDEQARLIKRYTNHVIIAYDSDDAGVKAALRNSSILESRDLNVSLISIPPPHDPDSYILSEGTGAFYTLIKNKISPVEFRFKHYFNTDAEISVEDKNAFIDGLFEDLLTIPNEVKIGLYLHQIAGKMQMQESFLISRFNQLKKQKRYGGQNVTREASEQEKQPSVTKHGQWQAEEGIIALLLINDATISRQILEHLSASDFVNEEYRVIFEKITLELEELGEVDIKVLQKELDPEQDSSIVSRLLLFEINNPAKLAADCIYKMRKWSLDSRFNEIKRHINDEASSPDAVLHYIKELTEIRNKLTDIAHERDKYLKTNL
jgi:DNA primase